MLGSGPATSKTSGALCLCLSTPRVPLGPCDLASVLTLPPPSAGWEVAGDHIYTAVGASDNDFMILTLVVPGFR